MEATTTPVLRTVAIDKAEFVALVDEFQAWGLSLRKYSRMLSLSKRIARRTNTTVGSVRTEAGLV